MQCTREPAHWVEEKMPEISDAGVHLLLVHGLLMCVLQEKKAHRYLVNILKVAGDGLRCLASCAGWVILKVSHRYLFKIPSSV